jgi:hypothetical protein
MRQLAQLQRDQYWLGGLSHAPLSPESTKPPETVVLRYGVESDLHAVKTIVISQLHVEEIGIYLDPPGVFANLKQLELHRVSHLSDELDLSTLTSVRYLIIQGEFSTPLAFPPALDRLALREVWSHVIPETMDLVYEMLLKDRRPLDLLELTGLYIGPNARQRQYVGHLIKHLRLDQIIDIATGRALTLTSARGSCLEPLFPPHTRCKSPRLIACCLELVPLFPLRYIGAFKRPNSETARPNIPAAPILTDAAAWPSTFIATDAADPIFSSLRMLEVRGPSGSKAEPIPDWLRDLELRMPQLQFFNVFLAGAKLPKDFLRHRNLTTLVIHRYSAKPFLLNGVGLASLQSLRLLGGYDEVSITDFPALLHLCVSDIQSSFSLSTVPRLHSFTASSVRGSMRLDAPNLRILSLDHYSDKLKFVSSPTLLQSLCYWGKPQHVTELAARMLKHLFKISCAQNLLHIQIRFFSKKMDLSPEKLLGSSTNAAKVLAKAISGSSEDSCASTPAYGHPRTQLLHASWSQR